MEPRDALFAALRYELTETLPAGFSFDGIDETFLKELYDYSNRQEVAHLVGDALERLGVLAKVSDEVAEPFRRRQAVAAYHAEQQKQVFEEVSAAFEEAEIPYLPLKGLVIRPLYPEPWMRTAGDLDILVKPEDLERASLLLENLGAKKHAPGEHEITYLFPTQEVLELHFRLLEDHRANDAKAALDDVWAHTLSVGASNRYVMEDAWFYYYHLVHMAKHLQEGSCGIRPFLDLWIINHKTEFDSLKRNDLLQKQNLLNFAEASENLAEVWISGSKGDDLSKALENFALSSGVFGSQVSRRATETYEKRSKLKYYLSRVFVPYSLLKRWEPKLEKHPWLFPFFQIKRWFRILFCGGIRHNLQMDREAEKLDQGVLSFEEMRERLGLLRRTDTETNTK